ncbi:RICIN domain-containing protein [Streptomyces albireticuli]|uniref:RICIN domain-containing protein n=1 Tax=Streptomyces albireticuli TaxID=1940 RepID=UPI003679E45A
MKITSKVAALAAAGAALVLTTPGPSLAASSNFLVNEGGNQCLTIENASPDNGARAVQGPCVTSKSEWRFVKADEYNYRIVNVDSGKCLEIADSRKDNGAPAQQWTCVDGADTQLWDLWFSDGSGFVTNKNSDKNLEIENSGTKVGAKAQQWAYAGVTGQRWRPVMASE